MTHHSPYFLGIDGGGTGTRARVTDASGRVLGAGVAGPATLRLGADAAWAALMAAGDAALAEAGFLIASNTVHAGIGVAGLSRVSARDGLLSRRHALASLTINTDAHMACVGAHGGDDGGIVIAGTGAIGYALVGGREVRVGGHGFPISDAGSGADIGLEAVRLTLRTCDGLAAETPVTAALMAALGGTPEHAIAWMDRATATEYAALAPIVVEHARAGDAGAAHLMVAAAGSITELIEALFQRGAPQVSLVGGLAAALGPWLAPNVANRLSPARGDAVDGALLVARRTCDADFATRL